jgi:diguanylate cyclase (GGDEF)-like protein/PAS domain S-box-containing protein
MVFWRRIIGREPAPAPVGASGDDAFRLLAENSADVIFRFGTDLRAKYISPSAQNLLGWTPEEIREMGGSAAGSKHLHPDDQGKVSEAIARHLSGEADELKTEFRMLHRDGSTVWVETNCRSLKDETGRTTDLILTMRDISLKKELEFQLAQLARTDALTGLANRRAFDETLTREWARASRLNNCVSLLVVDVDHFKKFNDHFGHQVGDDCLREVACSLRAAVKRPTDLVARYGGEEFALILPDTDQAGALDVAKRILAEIAAVGLPHPKSGTSDRVTVSIGVATAIATRGGTMRMPEGLLQAADSALYKAKASGRNRVETGLLLSPGS